MLTGVLLHLNMNTWVVIRWRLNSSLQNIDNTYHTGIDLCFLSIKISSAQTTVINNACEEVWVNILS